MLSLTVRMNIFVISCYPSAHCIYSIIYLLIYGHSKVLTILFKGHRFVINQQTFASGGKFTCFSNKTALFTMANLGSALPVVASWMQRASAFIISLTPAEADTHIEKGKCDIY